MKVILIHQAFVSPEEAGGTRHYEFASHCIESGIDFKIIASNLSYLTGKSVAEPRGVFAEDQVGKVKVIRARTFSSLHRSFFWRVISFLSFMASSMWAGLRAGPTDLVMGTTPPIFQAVSAWAIAAIRRKPFLLEVRDLWPEFAIDMGVLKNPILIRMSRWLERFLYKRADHILVNSPAYRDYLINKHQISHSKVSLIPNGVDVSKFGHVQDSSEIKAKLGLNDKFVVTYAGAIGLANDIPTILRAAKILEKEEQIVFLFVGDGKEKQNAVRLSKELNLMNVIFAGAYPKSKMPSILATSNVCLATLQNIPMFRTTYPNKVFDYMGAERPSILAIDGVIREVIEASEGGIFVNPGDETGLASAVLRLKNDPETCKQMGKSARAYVEKHFNRDVHAREFYQLISKLNC
ncbi:glycosyltransferase family 4 protein [Verrucomicrobia bacterium]|nr:glycosyltransferase family 4 protein [Verrucomicrobiota bacterium]